MGGPYCETCKYFFQAPLSENEGECTDPSKIIHYKGGGPANSNPPVLTTMECCNHSGLKTSIGEDFRGRVIEEKAELDKKVERLAEFQNHYVFKSLDTLEQDRLIRQHLTMQEYSSILAERIEAF